MDILYIEIIKLLRSRLGIVLALITTFIFPVAVVVTTLMSIRETQISEGLLTSYLSFGVISYSQLFLFIPTWIILLTGKELYYGHVNRYVFLRSRESYFLGKLWFSGIVTLYFSILGMLAFFLSIKLSGYISLVVPSNTYVLLFVQMTIINFLFSLLLLCLVFLIKSPTKTFVIYFMWTFIEGILFTITNKLFNISGRIFPLHMIRSLFTSSGNLRSEDYFNPLTQDPTVLLLPFSIIIFITFLTYKHFLKADLKTLSD